jgi:hypothetical protein
MGLIILMMWIGALLVLGAPSLALSILVAARSQRSRAFWLALAAAVGVSLLGQYIVISRPVISKGSSSWDFVTTAIFGWHLAVPAFLAGVVGIAARGFQRAIPAGAVSGLLLSIPLSIALAVPVTFVLSNVLGLRFEA